MPDGSRYAATCVSTRVTPRHGDLYNSVNLGQSRRRRDRRAAPQTPEVSPIPLGSIVGAQWYNLAGTRGTSGGWNVELLFATGIDQANDPNGRAAVGRRAGVARGALGLRVLVRVDHAPGQSLPPPGDDAGRTAYVRFLEGICQDVTYRENVFGYIIGNEFNLASENQRLNRAAGERLTPDWYARMFNGFGVDAADVGNAHAFIKTHQPAAWVLVGAIAPWSGESDGDAGARWIIDEPWLNYFHAACRRIFGAASASQRWPDGFAIHAYGRTGLPGSPSFTANEPHTDVPFGGRGAQGGFRVYRDWCAIIDAAGFAPNLPVFVTETNTLTGNPSSQSYPSGWYVEALQELQTAGPRFHALCWFVDNDPSGGWPGERLTNPTGNCVQASQDFDAAIASGRF